MFIVHQKTDVEGRAVIQAHTNLILYHLIAQILLNIVQITPNTHSKIS